MASVSSLDQDMRKLRLDRYTPQAAGEVKSWIESVLGEPLPAEDLLDALKDGVALCKLVNLAVPKPGIRFKASTMPFTQRENISQFLHACEMPPFNLPAHDRFLTVDLYDQKDPAQVMQCLGAFSRAANAANPSRFPHVIGPKRPGAVSPTRRNNSALGESADVYGRDRGVSNASQASDSAFSARQSAARTMSPTLTGGSNSSRATDGSLRYSASNVSSWSRKGDEGSTAPAWNIHQYGYMGGASQANQGISFGARRQVVSQGPQVPSLAEKEKKRREQETEAERLRIQADEAEHKRRIEREADEERERLEEQRRWEEESRKAKDTARQELEEQKRRWAEEERQWQEAEQQRQREEKASAEAKKGAYDGLGMQNPLLEPPANATPRRVSESERIRELERQLEEAKERERQYQLERQARGGQQPSREVSRSDLTEEPSEPTGRVNLSTPAQREEEPPAKPAQRPRPPTKSAPPTEASPPPPPSEERDFLREQWAKTQDTSPVAAAQPSLKRPLPVPRKSSAMVSASLSRSTEDAQAPAPAPSTPIPTTDINTSRPTPSTSNSFNNSTITSRPPRPAAQNAMPSFSRFSPAPPPPTTTGRFTASAAPTSQQPSGPRFAQEVSMGSTSERAAEDARRNASQARTIAGGLANKSLLEREMERERERQREWEEAQMGKRGGAAGGKGLMGPREMKR